ncbi:hypothetical protein DFJ43DRAFT_1077788 [Lentinula guzmanii]|uniref:Uncharacterized protein n=1 Tax=Lentinula guzmanii TaxID=2804957 RepID=A0AA38N0X1_9AGAR|nr:hypothetical protein DFJ43DRAFT_1077788 [Lentinula guzmanii]
MGYTLVKNLGEVPPDINKLNNVSYQTVHALERDSQSISDPTLKDLLPFEIAIHHAGLSPADRSLVEGLFSGGSLSLLISTTT